MRRPGTTDPSWNHHQWELVTYAWLRSMQQGTNPIVAGILFYLNELAASREDTVHLKSEVSASATDTTPVGTDVTAIGNCARRALCHYCHKGIGKLAPFVCPSTITRLPHSLGQFDGVVTAIENSIVIEMDGGNIRGTWDVRRTNRRWWSS